MWLKVLKWIFAALIAMSNPLDYCLKYGGNLNLTGKALQAGGRFTKVMGGSIEMTCLCELHEISSWSGSIVTTAQLP